MSDPYDDLACSIEGLREDLQDLTRVRELPLTGLFDTNSEHGIFRAILEELKMLRAEITELTGAIFSMGESDE